MSVESLMPTLLKLSVAEREELIERLTDSLPESLEPSGIPEWHIEILEQRLANAKAHPEDRIPWEEAKKKLRAKR